jgi:hypothetical protein
MNALMRMAINADSNREAAKQSNSNADRAGNKAIDKKTRAMSPMNGY